MPSFGPGPRRPLLKAFTDISSEQSPGRRVPGSSRLPAVCTPRYDLSLGSRPQPRLLHFGGGEEEEEGEAASTAVRHPALSPLLE